MLLSYAWWWGQAAAVVNQLTQLILAPTVVTDGMRQLMAYAVEGTVLGGWQLIDLGLMAALALELLALIVVKVVIVLVGAIVFATGPVTIGLVPTETGATVARAWASAAVTVLIVPVAWAAIIAVGSVLIGDATTAGPLVGGNSAVGQLLGGVVVAVAGAATLWLCLKASREAAHVLRAQVGGAMASAGRARGNRTVAAQAPSSGPVRGPQALRRFQGQIRQAARTTHRSGAGGTGGVVSPQGTGGTGTSVAAGRGGRGVTVAGGAIRAGARSAGHMLTRVTREASGDPATSRTPGDSRRGTPRSPRQAKTGRTGGGIPRPRLQAARAGTSSRRSSPSPQATDAVTGASVTTRPATIASLHGAERTPAKTTPPSAPTAGSQPSVPQPGLLKPSMKGAAAGRAAAPASGPPRHATGAGAQLATGARVDSPRTRATSPSARPHPPAGSPARSGTRKSTRQTRPAQSQPQRPTPAGTPTPTVAGGAASRPDRRSSTTDRPQTVRRQVQPAPAARSWRLRIGRRAD